jgi:hypothetical protein
VADHRACRAVALSDTGANSGTTHDHVAHGSADQFR